MFWKSLPSPVGVLILESNGTAITGLWMKTSRFLPEFVDRDYRSSLPVFRQAENWLAAYFAGESLPALPPLRPAGSVFQKAVWEELLKIPYGKTATYGDISERLNDREISASAQSVGGAVGHNPILILIPCHRVLGSRGALGGYSGGLEAKKALLELEGSL